jgi:hypothetical protein
MCVLGLGLSKPNSFSGHLYKEASRLGFREFSCFRQNYRVCLVKHPSGETALPCYRIKLLRRFLCSSRIVVLWFEAWCSSSRCLLDSSSSSGDILHVVGRFLSSLTHCERSGQNSKDHRRDPYHVVSDYWVDHRECFL